MSRSNTAGCAVFSPCGRYWIRFRSIDNALLLQVVDKSAMSDEVMHISQVRPTLGARLTPKLIEEISSSAGVKRDLDTFSMMMHTALVGQSPALSFFIENCEEMHHRIRKQAQGHQNQLNSLAGRETNDDISAESQTLSSAHEDPVERAFFHQQRFFTLDYCVHFIRAIFPIPLEPFDPARHTEQVEEQQPSPESFLPEDKSRAPIDHASIKEIDALRIKVRQLSADNKKMKRENEALTLLSNEKMSEMQRICDDLQRRAVNEGELRRLKRELMDAHKKIAALEQMNEKLKREAVNSRRSPAISPRRSTPPGNSAARRPSPSSNDYRGKRGRFDTPPSTRHVAGGTPVLDGLSRTQGKHVSPAGSRSSTPPRSPRPAWGQHQPRMELRSPLKGGGYHSTSMDTLAAESEGSSHRGATSSTFDRLYRTDTAVSASSRRQKDTSRLLFY